LQIEIEFVKTHALGFRAHLERPGTQHLVATLYTLNADIQRRHPAGVEVGQRIRRIGDLFRIGVRRRQTYMLQVDTNRHPLGVGQQHATGRQLTVDLHGPTLTFALKADGHLVNLLTETAEAFDIQSRTAQQALAVGVYLYRMIAAELLPGLQIQFFQTSPHAQALAWRQAGSTAAEHKFSAAVGQCSGRRGEVQTGQSAIVRPVTALAPSESHAPAGSALLRWRLAERRR